MLALYVRLRMRRRRARCRLPSAIDWARSVMHRWPWARRHIRLHLHAGSSHAQTNAGKAYNLRLNHLPHVAGCSLLCVCSSSSLLQDLTLLSFWHDRGIAGQPLRPTTAMRLHHSRLRSLLVGTLHRVGWHRWAGIGLPRYLMVLLRGSRGLAVPMGLGDLRRHCPWHLLPTVGVWSISGLLGMLAWVWCPVGSDVHRGVLLHDLTLQRDGWRMLWHRRMLGRVLGTLMKWHVLGVRLLVRLLISGLIALRVSLIWSRRDIVIRMLLHTLLRRRTRTVGREGRVTVWSLSLGELRCIPRGALWPKLGSRLWALVSVVLSLWYWDWSGGRRSLLVRDLRTGRGLVGVLSICDGSCARCKMPRVLLIPVGIRRYARGPMLLPLTVIGCRLCSKPRKTGGLVFLHDALVFVSANFNLRADAQLLQLVRVEPGHSERRQLGDNQRQLRL